MPQKRLKGDTLRGVNKYGYVIRQPTLAPSLWTDM